MSDQRIRFRPQGDDEFRRVLNARVDAYFARAGKRRVATGFVYGKAAVYGTLTVAGYATLLGGRLGGTGTFAVALLYGLAALMLALNVSHDAAHVAITGRRRFDTVLQRVLFGLVGVDGYLWRLRHDGSHHVLPNVNGCDIDIDQNPVIRLSPNHPRRPWQRYQHLYAAFAYLLTLLDSIFVNDLAYLRKRALANMRDIRHPAREVAIFWLLKAAYIVLNLAVPMLILPFAWWQVLLGYLAVTGAQSLVFVFLLVGTHFSHLVRFPQPGPDGTLAMSWAEHALATSVDWAPESLFAHCFSGGSNAHAAHHLFPRVSHGHYRALTPIIRRTAREFGIVYNETSFTGMIASHFRHLRAMARDGAPSFTPALSSPRMPAR